MHELGTLASTASLAAIVFRMMCSVDLEAHLALETEKQRAIRLGPDYDHERKAHRLKALQEHCVDTLEEALEESDLYVTVHVLRLIAEFVPSE